MCDILQYLILRLVVWRQKLKLDNLRKGTRGRAQGTLSSGSDRDCTALARVSSWVMKVWISSVELWVQARGRWAGTGLRSAKETICQSKWRLMMTTTGWRNISCFTWRFHGAHLERTAHWVFWQQLKTRPTTRQCLPLALHCAVSPPSSGGTEALMWKQLETGFFFQNQLGLVLCRYLHELNCFCSEANETMGACWLKQNWKRTGHFLKKVPKSQYISQYWRIYFDILSQNQERVLSVNGKKYLINCF